VPDPPGVEFGRRPGGLGLPGVGRLVVIEGLDGAGKRTLGGCADRGADRAWGQGSPVAAFPRYDTDVYGPLVADALHGRLGDLTDSVHGMAVLFALDRRAAGDELRAALAESDVLLVDRYLASNAAYGGRPAATSPVTGSSSPGCAELELERFGHPGPGPAAAAPGADRGGRRGGRPAGRRWDAGARSGTATSPTTSSQRRCGRVYDQLASLGWVSPWRMLDGATEAPADVLAKDLLS